MNVCMKNNFVELNAQIFVMEFTHLKTENHSFFA